MHTYSLYHKNILLIVCGSIAAYKSPDIVRRASEVGASVKVILTSGGAEFITQMSLEAVGATVFTEHNVSEMPHISLAKWADIVLIAPTSSNMIAKIAHGESDDLASLAVLSTTAPVYIAPAMNKEMLANSATQHNLGVLESRNMHILVTGNGEQACGDVGYGRMLEPQDIIAHIAHKYNTSALSGKKVLITLGATREAIDPVRYISNNSSGKMGVSLAKVCMSQGMQVTLIHGSVAVHLPEHSTNISASSAQMMLERVEEHIPHTDVFISVAAVSDYRVAKPHLHKIKKSEDTFTLELLKNPDILATISQKYPQVFTIGFAVETESLEEYAKAKLHAKQLDMIVANTMDDGFGNDTNAVLIIDSEEHITKAAGTKDTVAQHIIDTLEQLYAR